MESTDRERMWSGLPVTEHRLRVAGAETVVMEAGAGAPVVLLHGGIECGGAYWAPVVAALARDRRVIVPDMPGLGESEPLPRPGLEPAARWLYELMGARGAEGALLVAHSLAGAIGLRCATRLGDDLERLVVYGAPAVGPFRMSLRLRVTAVRFALRSTERNEERFARLAFRDLDAFRRRQPDWYTAFSRYNVTRARTPHVKRTMRALIKACTVTQPDGILRGIEAPTELLWGSDDRFVPLALAEEASAVLGWPLRVVERAGHATHIEDPLGFLAALRAEMTAETGLSARPASPS